MAARKRRKPRCIVIAGPNGAGKTTFAKKYLPNVAGLVHFINADLIAGGIYEDSNAVGSISSRFINPWQTGGLYMRILDRNQFCWSEAHDN
jgi:adenylate kinase family enzyme